MQHERHKQLCGKTKTPITCPVFGQRIPTRNERKISQIRRRSCGQRSPLKRHSLSDIVLHPPRNGTVPNAYIVCVCVCVFNEYTLCGASGSRFECVHTRERMAMLIFVSSAYVISSLPCTLDECNVFGSFVSFGYACLCGCVCVRT